MHHTGGKNKKMSACRSASKYQGHSIPHGELLRLGKGKDPLSVRTIPNTDILLSKHSIGVQALTQHQGSIYAVKKT